MSKDIDFTDAPEMTTAEALASIQASTVELLKGIRPTAFPDPLGGEAEWKMWGEHYVKEIDQLIKDLSNGK